MSVNDKLKFVEHSLMNFRLRRLATCVQKIKVATLVGLSHVPQVQRSKATRFAYLRALASLREITFSRDSSRKGAKLQRKTAKSDTTQGSFCPIASQLLA